MGSINYNDISKVYDDVRKEEGEIIKVFLDEINPSDKTSILDIGCGTGNYTDLIERLTRAKVHGIDKSEGMIEKARNKNNKVILKVASVDDIPFEDNTFDFVYMIDVIHHIPKMCKLFSEIHRILKIDGKACIVTQSHKQIDLRYMTEFFPSTAVVDKSRYPEIDEIIKSAKNNKLNFMWEQHLGEGYEVELGDGYLELLEKKGYSMLHLISDKDYNEGLNRVRSIINDGTIIRKAAGATLVWFIKNR